MEFQQLIALIEEHCPEMLPEKGEVFFGSKQSLRDSNGIALIGLNPGGDGLSSIQNNLKLYLEDTSKENFSGYLDQCWHEPFFSRYETCDKCKAKLLTNGIVHQDKHQKMISKIANVVGFDLRRTIALNAIWVQTRNAVELQNLIRRNGYLKMNHLFKEKIFPVVSEIFRACGIRLIVCLGNGKTKSSFEFFRDAYKIPELDVKSISSDYRDGKFFIASTHDEQNLFFFGIPHPSMHQLTEQGIKELKAFKEKAFTQQIPLSA